jgi:hypothetical protein
MLIDAFIYEWNTERNVITSEYYQPRTLKKALNYTAKDDDSESDEEELNVDIDDDDDEDEERSSFRKGLV